MMPTIFHNFLETATHHSKQFLATALNLQAMQSQNEAYELYFNENFYKTNTIHFQFLWSLFWDILKKQMKRIIDAEIR